MKRSRRKTNMKQSSRASTAVKLVPKRARTHVSRDEMSEFLDPATNSPQQMSGFSATTRISI
jgi:hypothetical protein